MYARCLLVCVCAVLVSAGLSAASIQKRSFSVERRANPHFTGRNGPRALVRAYRKFLVPVPQGLLDAAEAQDLRHAEARAKRSPKTESFGPVKLRRPHGKGLLDNVLESLGVEGEGGIGGNAGQGQGQGQEPSPGRGRGDGNGGGNGGSQQGHPSCHDGNNNGNASSAAPPPSYTNGTSQQGRTEARPANKNAEYVSPVQIGGQTVNLDFDTGSSDLWVFSTSLGPQLGRGHNVYDPSKSATARAMPGASFQIRYGDGSGAKGNITQDRVTVGGVSVEKQAVGVPSDVSQSFVDDVANDGLLGLAFPELNTATPERQNTFFENIKSSLPEPILSADLRRGAAGSYTFGRVDPARFRGNLAQVKVDSADGFWKFPSDRFIIGDGQVQTSKPGAQAIADTGTSLMLGDATMVRAYYQQVQGARLNAQMGGFTVPCDAKMPNLTVAMGDDVMATVQGENFIFANITEAECFGGLQVGPPKLQIYGDVFFQSMYVVFNAGNISLGVAPHA
ncbi:aspartyl protease [Metarhizium album ARSEF 1941]|uniref:Aspartyl protease n=1 Tax=Metarhizium album (strain ARSEF 1941) TaxID=1081103 RepID=A0A0B2WNI7_METAS|nr:aspartyl protease [Metarhizium album ARSEF 1941]KHN95052.1 aspartyl protease [Metarhizium album ARSEF 1941]